jgi:hypothetical protein
MPVRDVSVRLFGLLIGGIVCSASPRVPRFHPWKHHPAASPLFSTPVNLNKDLVSQCSENYRGTLLDHFTWQAGDQGSATFNQRYFICDKHWWVGDGRVCVRLLQVVHAVLCVLSLHF